MLSAAALMIGDWSGRDWQADDSGSGGRQLTT